MINLLWKYILKKSFNKCFSIFLINWISNFLLDTTLSYWVCYSSKSDVTTFSPRSSPWIFNQIIVWSITNYSDTVIQILDSTITSFIVNSFGIQLEIDSTCVDSNWKSMFCSSFNKCLSILWGYINISIELISSFGWRSFACLINTGIWIFASFSNSWGGSIFESVKHFTSITTFTYIWGSSSTIN